MDILRVVSLPLGLVVFGLVPLWYVLAHRRRIPLWMAFFLGAGSFSGGLGLILYALTEPIYGGPGLAIYICGSSFFVGGFACFRLAMLIEQLIRELSRRRR